MKVEDTSWDEEELDFYGDIELLAEDWLAPENDAWDSLLLPRRKNKLQQHLLIIFFFIDDETRE